MRISTALRCAHTRNKMNAVGQGPGFGHQRYKDVTVIFLFRANYFSGLHHLVLIRSRKHDTGILRLF